MMGISLVMATLGRVHEVDCFIKHLANQTCREFELIVVDQNPDNRLAPLFVGARQSGIELTHIVEKEANQCRARNKGLAVAKYDYVAFPDDDCWYEPDVIEKVLSRFNSGDHPDGVIIRWQEQDPEGRQAHIVSNDAWRRYRDVQASAICQFLRTESVKHVAGFDIRLGLHSWFGGAEETDLMFRILAIGSRIAYAPDILVHHLHGRISEGAVPSVFKRTRSRARGTGALYARHGLDFFIVLRGLVSPWARFLINIYNPRFAVAQLGTAIGRAEGFLRWMLRES